MTTRIEKSTIAKGKLEAKEDILIEGRFEGEVISQNKVTVAKGAFVKGPIKCKEIDIIGIVEGNVFAEDCAKLFAFGKIQGDLKTGHLFVEDGGILAGKVETEGRSKIVQEDEKKRKE